MIEEKIKGDEIIFNSCKILIILRIIFFAHLLIKSVDKSSINLSMGFKFL